MEQDVNKYFNITNSKELIEQKLAEIIPYYDENNSLKFIGLAIINEVIGSSLKYTFNTLHENFSPYFIYIPVNIRKILNPIETN